MLRNPGFLVCFACVLLACSDDNESARPLYRSGVVAANMPVSGLQDAQFRQLCTSLDAHVQTEIGFEAISYIACLPAAIVLGGSPKGCEAQLDSCMNLFPKPIVIEAQLQDESVCFADLRECQATVAALETCVNVNLELVLDILQNWSCGDADAKAARDAAARAMDTANVCVDLDAACNRFAVVGPD